MTGNYCGAEFWRKPPAAPERADVAAVMTLVWALVRSGPNFDGRQVDVQRAVAANPPKPCARQYALSECLAEARSGFDTLPDDYEAGHGA